MCRLDDDFGSLPNGIDLRFQPRQLAGVMQFFQKICQASVRHGGIVERRSKRGKPERRGAKTKGWALQCPVPGPQRPQRPPPRAFCDILRGIIAEQLELR